LLWLSAGGVAIVAGDLQHLLHLDPTESAKAAEGHRAVLQIDRRWTEKAAEASARVLREFNAAGRNAHFLPEDPDLLERFMWATVAAHLLDYAQRGSDPAIPASIVEAGVAASRRVLTEFNTRGESSAYAEADMRAVRSFDREIDRLAKGRDGK
jgi:hypothetical protein